MLPEKYEQLSVVFESKLNMPYPIFKNRMLVKLIKLYKDCFNNDFGLQLVIPNFVEQAFDSVLSSIEDFHFDRISFKMFFSNKFALSIHEQIYEYRSKNNFEESMLNQTVLPADIILLFN
jgi:hypothetical protein